MTNQTAELRQVIVCLKKAWNSFHISLHQEREAKNSITIEPVFRSHPLQTGHSGLRARTKRSCMRDQLRCRKPKIMPQCENHIDSFSELRDPQECSEPSFLQRKRQIESSLSAFSNRPFGNPIPFLQILLQGMHPIRTAVPSLPPAVLDRYSFRP